MIGKAMNGRINSRPKRLLITLAGVLIAAFSTVAIAGDGEGDPPPDDDGSPFDEEAVGSLPMLGGDVVFLYPGLPGWDLPPSLFISGPTQVILDALIDATGMGHVALHPTGTDGRSIAIVHGYLHIDLDVALFQNPLVTTGMLVGVQQRRVPAGLFHEGRLIARRSLAPMGRFALPIDSLYDLGMLEEGVDLFAAAGGSRAHVQVKATGGVVSLQQMN